MKYFHLIEMFAEQIIVILLLNKFLIFDKHFLKIFIKNESSEENLIKNEVSYFVVTNTDHATKNIVF